MKSQEVYDSLKSIAERNGLFELVSACDAIQRTNKLALCLMGHFSIGKTTLLNKWFNLKLPISGDDATTHKLCRIEGVDGQTEQARYWHECDGKREEVSEGAFAVLCTNVQTQGSLIVSVPMTPMLRNCIVLDTPGLCNSTADDRVVLGAASLADYVCYCTEGVFSETDEKFLNSTLLKIVLQNTDFVVTRADLLDDDVGAIIEHNKDVVASIEGDGAISSERFLSVTTREAESVKNLIRHVETRIEALHYEMIDSRKLIQFRGVRDDLVSQLETKRKAMTFDDTQFSNEEIVCVSDLRKSSELEQKAKLELSRSGKKFGNVMRNYLAKKKSEFFAAKDVQAKDRVVMALPKEVGELIKEYYKQEFSAVKGDAAADMSEVYEIVSDINLAVRRSSQVGDFFTIVGTAALATLGPAEGGANFYEALAGAIVGGSNKEQILGSLRKINPVAIASDFFVELYQEKCFDALVDRAPMIADHVVKSTYQLLMNYYVLPHRQAIHQRLSQLKRIAGKKSAGEESFKKTQSDIDDDLATLNAIDFAEVR